MEPKVTVRWRLQSPVFGLSSCPCQAHHQTCHSRCPRGHLAPSTCPLPSPFMAFRKALASASGLKSPAGCTVPFSCKKQKATQEVSGGPPGGQAKRGACEGGEASPGAPNQAAWGGGGGRGGGQGTADRDRPRAERRRSETDSSLGTGQVQSRGEWPPAPKRQLCPSSMGAAPVPQKPALSPRPSCLLEKRSLGKGTRNGLKHQRELPKFQSL